MREIIQVIRCDLCSTKVDFEDDLFHQQFSWGKRSFELEVCQPCYTKVEDLSIKKLMEIGHEVATAPARRSRKSKAATPQLLHPELVCPVCGNEFATPAGLGRHRSAKHGYVSPKRQKVTV